MQATLQWLQSQQLPSGQFPTFVQSPLITVPQPVSTLTPTYLVALILTILQRDKQSSQVLEHILQQALAFIYKRMWVDEIEGYRVWHFNSFYCPDWEETSWCAWLLYQHSWLSKKDLEPLLKLLRANESKNNGVGVWLKDLYTKDNAVPNAFDPIVSLAVTEFLKIFKEESEPTETFLQKAITKHTPSLYYPSAFQDTFYWLAGRAPKPSHLKHTDYILFHNARRVQLKYIAPAPYEAAHMLLAA